MSKSLDKEIERFAKKKKDLEEQRMHQASDYENRRGFILEMERQVENIFKEHELAKEQLAVQKAERVHLELALKKVTQEVQFQFISQENLRCLLRSNGSMI